MKRPKTEDRRPKTEDLAEDSDRRFMNRALQLAARGEGHVEPNPMVGCVIVRDDRVVGEGWHKIFGGPHAEVEALNDAGAQARGASLYVTLEPCCHQGKTPPCTQALADADVARVIIGVSDPNPDVDGRGIAQLEAAGIQVDIGIEREQACVLGGPYRKLLAMAQPWVLAKWAMTLDGKLATAAGDSQWISSDASRQVVHQIRGRVDAIVVGRGTAEADDPQLTARPAGPRLATRIVVDSAASLLADLRLVQTARKVPVMVAVGERADEASCRRLTDAGVEVLRCAGSLHVERLKALLKELGRRRMTNVLVEGGSRLLGSLFDAGCVDEVHVFIAPKLLGGSRAPSPLAGVGVDRVAGAWGLIRPTIKQLDEDVYISGRLGSSTSPWPVRGILR